VNDREVWSSCLIFEGRFVDAIETKSVKNLNQLFHEQTAKMNSRIGRATNIVFHLADKSGPVCARLLDDMELLDVLFAVLQNAAMWANASFGIPDLWY
jgi:hypothetical protein